MADTKKLIDLDLLTIYDTKIKQYIENKLCEFLVSNEIV